MVSTINCRSLNFSFLLLSHVIRHPDKNADDPSAAEKYIKISNAYEVLSDEEKRRQYDRFGSSDNKHAGRNQHFDPFEFFSGGFQQQVPILLFFSHSVETKYSKTRWNYESFRTQFQLFCK